jgi:Autoinducer binding domain
MVDVIAAAMQAPFTSYEQATKFLEETVERASVKHLSYWYLRMSDGVPDDVVWVSTYDPAYMSHYMATYTPLGDPVIEGVLEDNRVLDWSEWMNADGVSHKIYAVAKNYGLTKWGISIPFRVEDSGTVVFSVCIDSNDEEWTSARRVLVDRFRPFSHDFHNRMKPLLLTGQKGETMLAY